MIYVFQRGNTQKIASKNAASCVKVDTKHNNALYVRLLRTLQAERTLLFQAVHFSTFGAEVT